MHMKMILRLFILLLVLSAALGVGLAVFSCHIRRQTLEQAMAWQAAHYDISWYDSMEKTDYTVKSYDGYELHVQYLPNPEAATDRYVVISHGYSDNRLGSLKYAMVYFHLGYNVIVYDLRGHGENKPTFCTYSVRESRDLLALLEDTRTRYPDMRVLGIHGESLGAGTSIACLKEHPAIDFVVADCDRFCGGRLRLQRNQSRAEEWTEERESAGVASGLRFRVCKASVRNLPG